jgi:16S rRNA (guanine527-N7)-methyltransferase
VTSEEFQERLKARAENAGISVGAAEQAALEAYFHLLDEWNAKINLTALPLNPPSDATIDRLLIEPLVAARYVAASVTSWFDVGSGGGSPAIPLKIMHPRVRLTMIESRTRKAAFLREAVRALGMAHTFVESLRFEEVAALTDAQTVDLITVRAVKSNETLATAIRRVLAPQGRGFFFHSAASPSIAHIGLETVETVQLGAESEARLTILKPVFRNNIVENM